MRNKTLEKLKNDLAVDLTIMGAVRLIYRRLPGNDGVLELDQEPTSQALFVLNTMRNNYIPLMINEIMTLESELGAKEVTISMLHGELHYLRKQVSELESQGLSHSDALSTLSELKSNG